MALFVKMPGRIFLALLTPVFLALSFPDFDQGLIAWIALVPLFIACHGRKPAVSFLIGLATGVMALYAILWWAFVIPGMRYYHGIIAALYLGLYPAVWCWALSLAEQGNFPLIIVAPCVWVALDFIKSHAGFLSFPWAILAHSQHKYPVILQISSVTGEYGVTFLIVLVNTAIALIFIGTRFRQQALALLAVLGVVVFGICRTGAEPSPVSLRIAAVEPCIQPGEQDADTGQVRTLKKLEGLTSTAAGSRPDLVVWPETAVLNLLSSPEIMGKLHGLGKMHGVPILLGASERVKFNNYALKSSSRQGVRSYNAAYVVYPDTGLAEESYRKNILVPFGEYLPFGDTFQWPAWFVSEVFETVAGDSLTIFDLKDGRRFGVLICWENLFSEVARREARAGAGVLFNLVNDVWLGKKAAPRQHNSASVLRAVENGVPVVVVSNCGPSQIIDGKGRVLKSTDGGSSRGIVSAEVAIGRRLTFYTRYGDCFAWLCIAFSLLIFVKNGVKRIIQRRSNLSGPSNI